MPKLILNGKEYANNKPDGYPPIIYSDEEREVGVWRDGKPLYQKTISFSPSSSANTLTIAHNISNIERVIKYEGSLRYSSGSSNDNRFLPQLYKDNIDYYSASVYSVNNTNIYLVYGNWLKEQASVFNICVTLYYTKTTDTAGSGKWATKGTPTHHYSTTEHIIGTDEYGDTIYEKTFNPTISPGSNTLQHGISNLKRVKKIFGSCKYNNLDERLPLPYVSNNSSYMIILGNVTNTTYLIQCNSSSGFSSFQDVSVTIQYTKTTD